MMRAGVIAEFDSPQALLAAAARLRQQGFTAIDGHTPFAVPGAEEAFGLRRSRLPAAVLSCALAGATGAYALQAWTVAVSYPLNVGGRPAYSPPIFVPITFEMGVLSAAFAAFIALLALSGLPRLWDALFEVPAFESASRDRFWVAVERADPAFDSKETPALLSELGALRVVVVGEEAE
jgi:hypothetical protein